MGVSFKIWDIIDILDLLLVAQSLILTEFRRKLRGDPVYNETRLEIKDKERKRRESKKMIEKYL